VTSYLQQNNFSLELHFAENPFFENAVLKKTYNVVESGPAREITFDSLQSTAIKWKPNKNLTVKQVTRQAKKNNRGGGGGRKRGGGRGGQSKPVTVTEPCESFFHFFDLKDTTGMSEEELEDPAIVEEDYEMGLELRDKIVPFAVSYFCGDMEEEDDVEEGEMYDPDEEYDSDEDDDYEPGPNDAEKAPECKQQ